MPFGDFAFALQRDTLATAFASVRDLHTALHIVRDLTGALVYLHEHGAFHGTLSAAHVHVPDGPTGPVLLGGYSQRSGPPPGTAELAAEVEAADVAGVGALLGRLLDAVGDTAAVGDDIAVAARGVAQACVAPDARERPTMISLFADLADLYNLATAAAAASASASASASAASDRRGLEFPASSSDDATLPEAVALWTTTDTRLWLQTLNLAAPDEVDRMAESTQLTGAALLASNDASLRAAGFSDGRDRSTILQSRDALLPTQAPRSLAAVRSPNSPWAFTFAAGAGATAGPAKLGGGGDHSATTTTSGIVRSKTVPEHMAERGGGHEHGQGDAAGRVATAAAAADGAPTTGHYGSLGALNTPHANNAAMATSVASPTTHQSATGSAEAMNSPGTLAGDWSTCLERAASPIAAVATVGCDELKFFSRHGAWAHRRGVRAKAGVPEKARGNGK